jgi:hypothetical protein
MTHEESAKLIEPGVGSVDDPAAFVTSELSAVFVAPRLAVYRQPVRRTRAQRGQIRE